MHSLLIPFPVPPWRTDSVSELRIDVNLPSESIERDLEILGARLKRPGDPLYKLPMLCLDHPGLTFRYRESDGEHYVYIEDHHQSRLVGYIVFNRLIELNRQASPYLHAPHAKLASDYQRLGIASIVYRWWLDAGNCLISGARQSVGANILWHKLSRDYSLLYADVRNKQLSYLGTQVSEVRRQDLHTRMLMLGRGRTLEQLTEQTGMLNAVEISIKPLPVALKDAAIWLRSVLARQRK